MITEILQAARDRMRRRQARERESQRTGDMPELANAWHDSYTRLPDTTTNFAVMGNDGNSYISTLHTVANRPNPRTSIFNIRLDGESRPLLSYHVKQEKIEKVYIFDHSNEGEPERVLIWENDSKGGSYFSHTTGRNLSTRELLERKPIDPDLISKTVQDVPRPVPGTEKVLHHTSILRRDATGVGLEMAAGLY